MPRLEYQLDFPPATYGILETGLQTQAACKSTELRTEERDIPSFAAGLALRGVLTNLGVRGNGHIEADWVSAYAIHSEIVKALTGESFPKVTILQELAIGRKVLRVGGNFTMPSEEEGHAAMIYFGGSSYALDPENGLLRPGELSQDEKKLVQKLTLGTAQEVMRLSDQGLDKIEIQYSFENYEPYTEQGTLYID